MPTVPYRLLHTDGRVQEVRSPAELPDAVRTPDGRAGTTQRRGPLIAAASPAPAAPLSPSVALVRLSVLSQRPAPLPGLAQGGGCRGAHRRRHHRLPEGALAPRPQPLAGGVGRHVPWAAAGPSRPCSCSKQFTPAPTPAPPTHRSPPPPPPPPPTLFDDVRRFPLLSAAVLPQDCVGPLVELCVERRGSQLEHLFLARTFRGILDILPSVNPLSEWIGRHRTTRICQRAI